MILFTIGYGGVDPRVLIAHLREAGVQTVVDVRLRPFSTSTPAYCRDELARLLAAEGLGYIHDEGLGNPVMEACRAQGSLEPYARHLDQHREALSPLLALMGRLRVAILCGCPNPMRCHRSVIAEAVLDAWNRGLKCPSF